MATCCKLSYQIRYIIRISGTAKFSNSVQSRLKNPLILIGLTEYIYPCIGPAADTITFF